MLVGGAILVVGFVAGSIHGRMRAKREFVCGCTHSLAMHDPKTGECNAPMPKRRLYHANQPDGFDYPICSCKQYVGERPPDSPAKNVTD